MAVPLFRHWATWLFIVLTQGHMVVPLSWYRPHGCSIVLILATWLFHCLDTGHMAVLLSWYWPHGCSIVLTLATWLFHWLGTGPNGCSTVLALGQIAVPLSWYWPNGCSIVLILATWLFHCLDTGHMAVLLSWRWPHGCSTDLALGQMAAPLSWHWATWLFHWLDTGQMAVPLTWHWATWLFHWLGSGPHGCSTDLALGHMAVPLTWHWATWLFHWLDIGPHGCSTDDTGHMAVPLTWHWPHGCSTDLTLATWLFHWLGIGPPGCSTVLALGHMAAPLTWHWAKWLSHLQGADTVRPGSCSIVFPLDPRNVGILAFGWGRSAPVIMDSCCPHPQTLQCWPISVLPADHGFLTGCLYHSWIRTRLARLGSVLCLWVFAHACARACVYFARACVCVIVHACVCVCVRMLVSDVVWWKQWRYKNISQMPHQIITKSVSLSSFSSGSNLRSETNSKPRANHFFVLHRSAVTAATIITYTPKHSTMNSGAERLWRPLCWPKRVDHRHTHTDKNNTDKDWRKPEAEINTLQR